MVKSNTYKLSSDDAIIVHVNHLKRGLAILYEPPDNLVRVASDHRDRLVCWRIEDIMKFSLACMCEGLEMRLLYM